MNNIELIDFLIKKLNVKPLAVTQIRVTVRKLSTLSRLKGIYSSPNNVKRIKPMYVNEDCRVNQSEFHYWVDMWSNDGLVTFEYDKK